MILVTGSRGLIGAAIADRLRRDKHNVRTFDIRDDPRQDIRDPAALAAALAGVSGVIHLAAVSRVVWAQRDPELTWSTNVDAFSHMIGIAASMDPHPWIVSASSREVYGEPATLPVSETAPLQPMNLYARSKVAGETLVKRAADKGLIANVARFSNVYGSVCDHPDRVVPAFALAAVTGGVARLEGDDHMFDFTHIDDVAGGLLSLAEETMAGRRLDPIHFVTGRGTTLRSLADIALTVPGSSLSCESHASRSYDVAKFVGDPARAKQVLSWSAETDIVEGFMQLAADFRQTMTENGGVPVPRCQATIA